MRQGNVLHILAYANRSSSAGLGAARNLSAIPGLVPVLSPPAYKKRTYIAVMNSQLLFASAATTLFIVVSILIMRHLRTSQILQAAKKHDYQDLTSGLPEPTMLAKA